MQSVDSEESEADEGLSLGSVLPFSMWEYGLGDYLRIDVLKVTTKQQFQTTLDQVSAGEALVEVINEVYNSTLESDKGLRDIDYTVILGRRLSRGVLRKVSDLIPIWFGVRYNGI